MLRGKKLKLVFLLVLLFSIFRPGFILALEINYPTLPFPGVDPPQVFLEKIKNGEIPADQTLPLYVKYFYLLFLVISGMAAFLAIVYGGFLYLFSTGSPGKMMVAKDQISSGVLGLVILFSSYLILTTINPRLAILFVEEPTKAFGVHLYSEREYNGRFKTIQGNIANLESYLGFTPKSLKFFSLEFEGGRWVEKEWADGETKIEGLGLLATIYSETNYSETGSNLSYSKNTPSFSFTPRSFTLGFERPPSPEEEPVKYLEVPLGWLIERTKVKAQVAKDQAEDVWYVGAETWITTHTSLKELAQCLELLTQECKCDRPTEDCSGQPGTSGCPTGTCKEPCNRCVAADICTGIDNPSLANVCVGIPNIGDSLVSCGTGECNLQLVIDAKQAELKLLSDQLLMEKEDAVIAKAILQRELVKLDLAETLMRISRDSPLTYYELWTRKERKEIEKIEGWENVEPIPLFSRGRGAGITPSPPPGDPGIPPPSGEQVNLLPYFQNTAGNNISSGEYFEAEDGNPFKIFKSVDHSYYEKFRYDGSYLYQMEDTTWATAEGNVKCSDTGNDAFYRRYGSYGVTCNNQASFGIGVPWVPLIMRVGETFNHPQSIVGFDKTTGNCCPTQYSGNLPHTTSLVYKGCIHFPTGVTSRNAIILRAGAGEGAENFYYDDGKGWIGFDRGVLGSGAYITDQIDPPQADCLEIAGHGFPGSPGDTPEVTLPPHAEDDPANFYVKEEGNEDFIERIKTLVSESANPPLPPGWTPPPIPDPPPLPSPDARILNIPALYQRDDHWKSVIINQCDPEVECGYSYYENGHYVKPKANSMACSGCGPTSLAMILQYFNQDVWPADMDGKGIGENLGQGEFLCGTGSYASNLATFAAGYGLSFVSVGFDDLQAQIRSGRPVMARCTNWGNLGWGHITVIKGVENGVVGGKEELYVYFQDTILGNAPYRAEDVKTEFDCTNYYAFFK